jgi:hypothetical protein
VASRPPTTTSVPDRHRPDAAGRASAEGERLDDHGSGVADPVVPLPHGRGALRTRPRVTSSRTRKVLTHMPSHNHLARDPDAAGVLAGLAITAAAPLAAADTHLVGSGCAAYAEQVPTGPGSVAAWPPRPLTVAASEQPAPHHAIRRGLRRTESERESGRHPQRRTVHPLSRRPTRPSPNSTPRRSPR